VTGNVGAVFLFEWKRSLTVPRMAWWLVLALFPVFIVGLLRFTIDAAHAHSGGDPKVDPAPRELWIMFLFALGPMLVSMLGTMLWVTPALSAELERRSWVYIASRPHGGAAMLLGKYLAAVTWVIPPVVTGLSIAIPLSRVLDGWQIWWAMTRLVCLSTPAYAAIYLLLGTVLPRRGMVLAVGYSLLFELIISFVPAVINKITVHHRLLALLIEWCKFKVSERFSDGAVSLIGNTPSWQHVLILMVYPPVLLLVSILLLRASEFSSSAESDV
jgi:ABC-type transport system involved in multi-copper enzyme maturation permease subunit